MKTLLAAFALVAITLSACTSEQNPVEPAPEAAVKDNRVSLYASIQQPDGTWVIDVEVPPNRCGVPAGSFPVTVDVGLGNPGLIGWQANDGVREVTKTVVLTWARDSYWPYVTKYVETWTVKMLPDGPTVRWTVTRKRGHNGWIVNISGIKCL